MKCVFSLLMTSLSVQVPLHSLYSALPQLCAFPVLSPSLTHHSSWNSPLCSHPLLSCSNRNVAVLCRHCQSRNPFGFPFPQCSYHWTWIWVAVLLTSCSPPGPLASLLFPKFSWSVYTIKYYDLATIDFCIGSLLLDCYFLNLAISMYM